METLKGIAIIVGAVLFCFLIGVGGVVYFFTEMLPSLAH